MWLKKLSITNFQKHSELEIDFINGVNLLCGDSGAGKTSIKHSIEFLCQHDTFKGQRMVGTKTTSVKGWFSNGAIVERITSASINRYILNEDEENPFNSVGRDAPEEIKEAIGIYPLEVDGEKIYLNSYSQIALPFLFDKSPSFRHKIFNKLTGNDVLDKLFGKFNKDILRIKRGLREETEKFEERKIQIINSKKEFEKAEAIHSRLKKRIENIKKLHERYSKLLELKELQEANKCDLQETKHCLSRIKFPEDVDIKQLKEKIDRFDRLNTAKIASEKICTGLNRVRGQIKDFSLTTFDIASLKGKIERFNSLKSIQGNLVKNKEMYYTVKEDIKSIDKELLVSIDNQRSLMAEMKFCPICQRPITEECLKEIKL